MKALIVDDEASTRRGLKKHIGWQRLGVTELQEADNGLDALEIVKDWRPDILLSDIRMPGLNGVELGLRVREMMPHCQIIFISGYSDKEYLRAAIRISVVDYVEKPIQPTEVEQAVENAIARLSVLKADRTAGDQPSYNRHHRAIAALLSGRGNAEGAFFPPAEGSLYTAGLVQISREGEGRLYYDFDLLDRLQGLIHVPYQATFEGAHRIQVIIHCSIDALAGMRRALPPVLEDPSLPSLAVVIGPSVKTAAEVPRSYQEAEQAAQQIFYGGYRRLYQVPAVLQLQYVYDEQLFDCYRALLAGRDQAGADVFLEQLLAQLRAHPGTPAAGVKSTYARLYNTLYEEADRLQKMVGTSFGYDAMVHYIWNRLADVDTLEALHRQFYEKHALFFEGLEDIPNISRNIMRTIAYIHSHLSNPELSLGGIAEQVFLAPNYLAGLFKKETGLTVGQYITQQRMQQARTLLAETNDRLYDVAKAVGYTDTAYFSKSFKKVTGMLPSEYREGGFR